MSVRTMAEVWHRSAHSGTELLMLLAIADFADDDGRAYPSVATLAKKTRMQPRNANYLLNALQASGELSVLRNQGPKGTNLYRINLAKLGLAPAKDCTPARTCTPAKDCTAPLQGLASTPAKDCAVPLQRVADEPSLNHQGTTKEPSKLARKARRGAAADPASESVLQAMFAKFWQAYPNKASKQRALKSFTKLRPTESLLTDILQAIERCKTTPKWRKDRGQFIEHAATFLNERRWEDESAGGYVIEQGRFAQESAGARL